ncbi:hypothetical protein [Spiroplasma endosymbiont of Lonchoptera lutea]|uniref:hypothetical protein n=1 Tax=Spiroplasma endosymbiont of Lonchoptera lutea TaxID=3066297 RepID=UPI0030CD64E1
MFYFFKAIPKKTKRDLATIPITIIAWCGLALPNNAWLLRINKTKLIIRNDVTTNAKLTINDHPKLRNNFLPCEVEYATSPALAKVYKLLRW